MSVDPIELIKVVPPAARRVLEVTERPTRLAEVSRSRAPRAEVVTRPPDGLGPVPGADCLALFAPVRDQAALASVIAGLPERAQVVALPDAVTPELTAALAATGSIAYETAPVLRAWRSPVPPPRVLLHCSVPTEHREDCDIRIHRPNAFLRTLPGLRVVTEIESFTPSLAHPDEARILVMHRSVPTRARDSAFLRLALENGYLIVLDLDDDPA